MQNPIKDLSDITQLLYDVTAAYEKEITRLTEENRRLERLLSVSKVFLTMCRVKETAIKTRKYTVNKLKEYIIRLGLKDYIKNSTLYKFYKRRNR